MVRNTHLPEQPQASFKVVLPKYTYGIRVFLCPSCNRKQHLKADDKNGATIKCTSCWEELLVIKNIEVENDLYEVKVRKVNVG